MLERAGILSTRFESAKTYLDWGVQLREPAYGCVVGKTGSGELLVLGGNQSDAVNIKAFSTSRVSGYR